MIRNGSGDADPTVQLYTGGCIEVMRGMPECSVDAIVTDPPAGIAFMGKDFDDPRTYNLPVGEWTQPITSHGFADGADRRPAPSIGTTSRNPMCQTCHRHKRGADACSCPEPDFDDLEHRTEIRRRFVAFLTAAMRECLRVLKPGGHAVVWAIPRTAHWTTWAIENAGFEIRDRGTLLQAFGQGFPKSRSPLRTDILPAIEKQLRAQGVTGEIKWR